MTRRRTRLANYACSAIAEAITAPLFLLCGFGRHGRRWLR